MTDQMRTELFKTAGQMILDKARRRRIITDDMEGFVETEFRWGGMADLYGVIFLAEIDCTRGTTKVSFIVRPQDIAAALEADGFWTDPNDYQRACVKHRLN